MEEDLEDHLRKFQRGFTGRNQRTGLAENVISKIAGMHIEDCIFEIFNFVNRMKTPLQRRIGSFGFLGSLDRIAEAMMFFRSKPLWAKIFHVVVAACTYRKIGFDDYQLLEMLGFKESLKKITDEELLNRFGFNDQGAMVSKFKKSTKRAHHGNTLLDKMYLDIIPLYNAESCNRYLNQHNMIRRKFENRFMISYLCPQSLVAANEKEAKLLECPQN